MYKPELVEEVAKKAGLTKKASEAAINAFTEIVAETLAKGEDVQVIGFGTFYVSDRAARKGKNPKTGEPMEIEACKVAKWKPAKPVKETINR